MVFQNVHQMEGESIEAMHWLTLAIKGQLRFKVEKSHDLLLNQCYSNPERVGMQLCRKDKFGFAGISDIFEGFRGLQFLGYTV